MVGCRVVGRGSGGWGRREASEEKPAVLILHVNKRQISLPLPEDDKLNLVLNILADKSVLIEEVIPKSLHAKLLKRAQSSKHAH